MPVGNFFTVKPNYINEGCRGKSDVQFKAGNDWSCMINEQFGIWLNSFLIFFNQQHMRTGKHNIRSRHISKEIDSLKINVINDDWRTNKIFQSSPIQIRSYIELFNGYIGSIHMYVENILQEWKICPFWDSIIYRKKSSRDNRVISFNEVLNKCS